MRIQDIVTNEAISLTQHFNELSKVVNDAIIKSLASVHELKNNPMLQDAEDEAIQYGSLRPLTNAVVQSLYDELFDKISEDLITAVDKIVPYTAVKFVQFSGNTNGTASGLLVNLSEKYVNDLTVAILNYINSVTINNLTNEDRIVDEFYNQIGNIIKPGKYQKYFMNDDEVQNIVDDMNDTLIHELVHVKQNQAQYNKGKTKTQYRSYLGKKKKDFVDPTGSVTDFNLYLASPQEIAAFSHNIALRVINDLNLRYVNRLQDIQKVDSDTILYFIDKFLNGRFKQPANSKEKAVYKRYMKLAYLEVDRFVDKVKEKLKEKAKQEGNI